LTVQSKLSTVGCKLFISEKFFPQICSRFIKPNVMTLTYQSLPKFSILGICCLLFSFRAQAQTTVSGIVTEKNGKPILGANVYLDGTYDGATSGINGLYSFTTDTTGSQTLVASFVSFETISVTEDVSTFSNYKVILKEDVNSLDTVVISAGTFEASDNGKVSVLKPLDVVTTASALGDFLGALQTLPGTTTVAEDGRLFVRGGDANETQIFIDGLRVFSPYTPTTANTPTRGRYSPFLFDGITFSTGGYSAEYGQALSSAGSGKNRNCTNDCWRRNRKHTKMGYVFFKYQYLLCQFSSLCCAFAR
jgi:hypothetical protein